MDTITGEFLYNEHYDVEVFISAEGLDCWQVYSWCDGDHEYELSLDISQDLRDEIDMEAMIQAKRLWQDHKEGVV